MKNYQRIGAAIILAVMVGIGGVIYWRHQEREWVNRMNMVPVLTAKKHVMTGRLVKKEETEIKWIPTAYREPGVITDFPSSPMRTRLGLLPGEQITESKLFDAKLAVGLAWKLTPGQVAMSFELTPEQSVGASIGAGDRVAVFGRGNEMTLLAKNIPVLSVHHAKESNESPLALANMNEPSLYTLALTWDQASLLSRARDKGPLQWALMPALSASDGDLQ